MACRRTEQLGIQTPGNNNGQEDSVIRPLSALDNSSSNPVENSKKLAESWYGKEIPLDIAVLNIASIYSAKINGALKITRNPKADYVKHSRAYIDSAKKIAERGMETKYLKALLDEEITILRETGAISHETWVIALAKSEACNWSSAGELSSLPAELAAIIMSD